MGSRTSPPPTCCPRSAPPATSRTQKPRASSTSQPDGRTCTRRSRSTPPPRSPSRARTTRNRSPVTGARWWRSSASPSSAPCSGSRRRRRRSSSATPSSCATACRGCGRRCSPVRCRTWRARAVAETTIHTTPALTVEAARFVDAQVAAVAGRIGPAQLDRLVAETIKRYDLAASDPAADPEDGYLHVDPRHATLHDEDVHFAGTMRFEAELDLADALDLDRSLVHGAALQKALGSVESLDVRRAKALGDLARTQTALDLATEGGVEARSARTSTTDDIRLPAAREVVLHAHFDATTAGEQTVFGPTGRMEEGQRLVLLDQVKSWCGDSRTKVTIKPVIDLNAELSTPAYDDPRPDPRTGRPARPDLRLPVVHPTGPWLRHRPRHRVRPRRRRRGSTPARTDEHLEPRRALPAPPPPQDPHRLALPRHRTGRVRVDQPPRPPLPTRPHRHHRDPTAARTRTTMTPPRTPPASRWRGHRHARTATGRRDRGSRVRWVTSDRHVRRYAPSPTTTHT